MNQFVIPEPFKAWCHQCQGEMSVPGVQGQGFASLEELQQHTAEAHSYMRRQS